MRLTFLLPHQRPATGGVYTIQRYAALLAPRHEVTLAVAKGEHRNIPECKIVSAKDAGSSDVVVVPADWSGPIPEGTRIYYLQGFGDPGNPTVIAHLEERRPVIAIANWLAEEARSRGCPTIHVPVGLDRAIFHPGAPAPAREESVLMLTHRLSWKGTTDGVDALSLVKRSRPGVRVTLFGKFDPGTDFAFVPEPSLEEVGELMRTTAVFACSSWEEGLGLAGMEAMACGAAVATTDTKGSRDYALDGDSALVTPPRQPAKLAGSIVRLLENPMLRDRIARGGLEQVERVPTWDASATRFEQALLSL